MNDIVIYCEINRLHRLNLISAIISQSIFCLRLSFLEEFLKTCDDNISYFSSRFYVLEFVYLHIRYKNLSIIIM